MQLQFLHGKDSGGLEWGTDEIFLCFEVKRNLLMDLSDKGKNGNFKITFKEKNLDWCCTWVAFSMDTASLWILLKKEKNSLQDKTLYQ